MDTQELMKTRRSTRRFLPERVAREKLEAVVEAGRYAPSGGNSQTTHLIVIEDKAVLDTLAKLVKEEFSGMEVTPGMYASMANAVRASKGERYVFNFDAPALIVAANKLDYGNAMADCACVLENMLLMANALDLGACWINQLRWLNENPVLIEYLRTLGLGEDERVFGSMALGVPDTPDRLPVRTPLPRTGNPVTWVG